MGLPGSGKTTLAEKIVNQLSPPEKSKVHWINADVVRRLCNDWDFSTEGRLRQANRLVEMANSSNCEYVVCDFVAPLPESRELFDADYLIWVDTIKEGRFDDTNRAFVAPLDYNYCMQDYNKSHIGIIIKDIFKI